MLTAATVVLLENGYRVRRRLRHLEALDRPSAPKLDPPGGARVLDPVAPAGGDEPALLAEPHDGDGRRPEPPVLRPGTVRRNVQAR